jgi:hypothetical protein
LPNVSIGSPAWMRLDSLIGMPTSCAIVLASTSPRCWRPAEILARYPARSATGSWLQPSNACVRRDRGVDVAFAAGRHLAHDLAGAGAVHVDGLRRAWSGPLAGEVELVAEYHGESRE